MIPQEIFSLSPIHVIAWLIGMVVIGSGLGLCFVIVLIGAIDQIQHLLRAWFEDPPQTFPWNIP